MSIAKSVQPAWAAFFIAQSIKIMTLFSTEKLDIAAFLMAKGLRYRGTRNDPLTGSVWEFEDPDSAFQMLDEFNQNGHAPAKTLLICRKQLLQEIKSAGASYRPPTRDT